MIKKQGIFVMLTVIIMVVSCVPNRKVAYLQYRDEYGKPKNIIPDSVVRNYKTGEYDYRLQVNDLLDIKIATMTPLLYNPFNEADKNLIAGQNYVQSYDANRTVQTSGYYIEEDGKVNLPVIGKLKLEGYTISQAEDTLEFHVRKYLEQPVVRIRLQNFRFSVIGEVEQEGTLTSGESRLTLIQALSMAGGPSEFGDISRIKVLRTSGNNTYAFYLNLNDEQYLKSPFYNVQPGDVIIVSPLKQRAYLKYASQNLAVFTSVISIVLSIFALTR